MRRRSGAGVLVLVAMALILLPLALSADTTQPAKPPEIRLPAPQTSGGMSLVEALAQRRSQRSFAGKPLSMAQIGQLCWAAQGITDEQRGHRTAPSAMGLYAIRVFVVDEAGAHEYLPTTHGLRRLSVDGALARLRTAVGQDSVNAAPVSMVVTMEPARLEARCGQNAERYSLLEAGHVAQNVLLQATAIGLVSLPVGGINGGKVAEALNLPAGLQPVYVLPLGYAPEKG